MKNIIDNPFGNDIEIAAVEYIKRKEGKGSPNPNTGKTKKRDCAIWHGKKGVNVVKALRYHLSYIRTQKLIMAGQPNMLLIYLVWIQLSFSIKFKN
jgi:hypothetical protein